MMLPRSGPAACGGAWSTCRIISGRSESIASLPSCQVMPWVVYVAWAIITDAIMNLIGDESRGKHLCQHYLCICNWLLGVGDFCKQDWRSE